MPKQTSETSTRLTKRHDPRLPRFKSEAEEADWYHSPAGRRFMDQRAESSGPLKRVKFNLKPTDPSVLDAITARVKAKQGPQTTAISLRVDNEDLVKLKAFAGRSGVPYQKLLKEIIHEALSSK